MTLILAIIVVLLFVFTDIFAFFLGMIGFILAIIFSVTFIMVLVYQFSDFVSKL